MSVRPNLVLMDRGLSALPTSQVLFMTPGIFLGRRCVPRQFLQAPAPTPPPEPTGSRRVLILINFTFNQHLPGPASSGASCFLEPHKFLPLLVELARCPQIAHVILGD